MNVRRESRNEHGHEVAAVGGGCVRAKFCTGSKSTVLEMRHDEAIEIGKQLIAKGVASRRMLEPEWLPDASELNWRRGQVGQG